MQLSVKNLHPVYFSEDRSARSGIWGQNIVLNPGDKVQIIAPSGSGKTSFIHFLYGVRKEFKGDIFFDDNNIRTLKPDQLALYRQQHLSIVFQDLRLFPNQTVEQNIELKRQLKPYHPASKIKEFAERLGISHKLNMPCSTCSYGEQQRVAIVRSLMQPFDFILMDEPFSNLDEPNREKAMQLILEEVDKRNAGIILADLKQLEIFKADKIFNL